MLCMTSKLQLLVMLYVFLISCVNDEGSKAWIYPKKNLLSHGRFMIMSHDRFMIMSNDFVLY